MPVKIFFTDSVHIIKYGIGQAFADMGHEVIFANVLLDENWLQKLDDFQPDFVFSAGGWGILDKLFPLLHYKKIPHIYWAIDDPPLFNILSLPFARESTFVFTPSEESIGAYQSYGIKADLLNFACHPEFNRPAFPDNRFNHDIVFVGNNYVQFLERAEAARQIIGTLIKHNYNIKIYGNEWWLKKDHPFFIEAGYYGGYLPIENLPEVCTTVPIVLGLHSVVNSRTMMSMRTFEILGNEGFFLTQWTPAIENLFINHHHLVWTKSAEETLELVDHYLARPEERKKIARQGQEEVYAKHTYHHRVRDIIKIIAGKEWEIPISSIETKKNLKIVIKHSSRFNITCRG